MSFSKDVKEELSLQLSGARHCRLAELSAMLSYGGRIILMNKSHPILKLQTESLVVARKYFTLIRKTFNINIDVSVKKNLNFKNNRTYSIIIHDLELIIQILKATKLFSGELVSGEISKVNQLIVQNTCCKRAYIRGAFLTSGSMSDPEKTYHFEIALSDYDKALQLQAMIHSFSVEAKIVIRKKYYVVYIKEGSQIVDMLNIMEAHVALMNFENVRILKEMRNSINRQVNCEAANINKTVTASSNQIDDIIYIKESIGFGDLAEGLEDVAKIRIRHPDAALKELGAMLSPPIGKSGVNHRLRKLSMIADHLREQKEGKS